MTREQEELLKNNPNFLKDFLDYCSVGKQIQFDCPKKKETKKEYQHRYYMEVTKKRRQQKERK